MNARHPQSPIIHIAPSTHRVTLGLGELWNYRGLVYFLIWRDIKVRYKQTVMGASWAILQPLFSMLIFSLFFGRLAGIPSDGIPYPLFSYVALVPWIFFANGLLNASNCLINNPDMLRKVYFPRLTMPISTILAGIIDFLIAFLLLILMMLFFGFTPNAKIFWLPLFLALALVTTLGVGFWFSAMNVLYRDVRYIVPFLIQAWLFATPIAYPSSLISQPWRTLYGINPMVGVVEGFRWALLNTDTAPGPIIAVSTLVAFAFLLSGVYYFRKMEKKFADVV